jgi:hypothetical protein
MHFGNGTPSGRVVKAATVVNLVPFFSLQYIAFNNMDFEGGIYGMYHTGSTNVSYNNCNIRKCGTGLYGIDCTNISYTGGSVTDCGSNGMFVELERKRHYSKWHSST